MAVTLDSLQTAIWIYDIDRYYIVWANQAALTLWDSPSVEALQKRDLKTGLSEAVKASLLQYQQDFKQHKVLQENWLFTPKGKDTQAFCQFSGFTLEDGRMAMLVEATTSDEHHIGSHESATTMISSYTIAGQFISGNPPFIKTFGEQVKHLNSIFCDHGALQEVYQATSVGQTLEIDVLMRGIQGDRWYRLVTVKTLHGQGEGTILFHQYDIHERKTSEQALRRQAWSDPLTGLLNRRGLNHHLRNSIKSQQQFTLLYIDLDGFKMVNDSSGHNTGDSVLVEVASRLRKNSLPGSKLCRFGGDEFVVVVYQVLSATDQASLLNALIDSVSTPYKDAQSNVILLSASIGVSTYPQHGDNIEQLIMCADSAMYQAKKRGKKQWVEYQSGMELGLKRLSIVAQQLSQALKNNELSLHYQPILNTNTGNIVSFEALLRWHNSQLGYVNADEAIKVAERTGLIHEIENWVLNQALADLLTFKSLISADISMAVNISGLHLLQPDLSDYVFSLLTGYALKPSDLTIELTETVLAKNIEQTNSPARIMTEHGIKLSIDDFGTGYSSLAYLHAIPASIVKVDRAFLEKIHNNTITLECIHTLVNSLNMQSLIEGIETAEQAKLLSELGFKLQQGYFHGRPQPLDYYLSANIGDLQISATGESMS